MEEHLKTVEGLEQERQAVRQLLTQAIEDRIQHQQDNPLHISNLSSFVSYLTREHQVLWDALHTHNIVTAYELGQWTAEDLKAHDALPASVERELRLWQGTPRELEELVQIAQEYGIEVRCAKRGSRTIVTYELAGHSFPADHWSLASEEALREGLLWIVKEVKRLNDLAAEDEERLRRAREGDQQARQEIIDDCVARLCSNLQQPHNGGRFRAVVSQLLDEALVGHNPYGQLYFSARQAVTDFR